LNGPGYVVLRCKTCKNDIARAAYAPFAWVHLNDEIKISAVAKITKNWDHEAEPDVIDVGVPTEEPKSPPIERRQTRSNPFY
jgi:hypothetical protein